MNIYFDMDGVLAIYEPDAYIQPHPKFMRLNEHYYSSVKPDELMIHLFNQLCLCKHHRYERKLYQGQTGKGNQRILPA